MPLKLKYRNITEIGKVAHALFIYGSFEFIYGFSSATLGVPEFILCNCNLDQKIKSHLPDPSLERYKTIKLKMLCIYYI